MVLDVCHTRDRVAVAHELRYLWVVAVINNPIGWRRRADLFRKFVAHIEGLGGQLMVVECVYGDERHCMAGSGSADVVACPGTDSAGCSCGDCGCSCGEPALPPVGSAKTRYVRVRAQSQLWHKENLINVGIRNLPQDAKYVAWIDADVFFTREDVLVETVHALQHYDVVQMFQQCCDLGPDGEVMATYDSFCSCHVLGKPYRPNYTVWHPGFAWAARLDFLSRMGGLLDRGILGAGDHHMALAFVGKAERSLPANVPPAYAAMVMEYQRRAETHMRRNLGYVRGTIMHGFHGSKKKRRYIERWDILTGTGFDPERDIRPNRYGVYELVYDDPERVAAVVELRDKVRRYFVERSEDATTND
jgi:hypothetical protein